MRSCGEELQTRTVDIEFAARSAMARLRDIELALRNQSSDVHLLTDQALLRIETTRKALNDQFQDLSASIGQLAG